MKIDSFVEVPESDEVDDERYTMWRSLVLSTAPSGLFPCYDCDDDDDDWFVEVTDDEDTTELMATSYTFALLPVVVPTIVITPPEEKLHEIPKESGNEVTSGERAEKLTSNYMYVSFAVSK